MNLAQVGRNRHGERKHFVSSDNFDLFFEHLFVCPSIGFYELLKEEYLPIVLNAQHESGCFKDQKEDSELGGGRKLLEEVELDDGCLFHMTAVASGALTQFLRYCLTLKYQPEKLNLDLLYDNKHYQEAVEASKLRPREKSTHYSYKFYLAVSLVNIIFLYIIIKRKLYRSVIFRKCR